MRLRLLAFVLTSIGLATGCAGGPVTTPTTPTIEPAPRLVPFTMNGTHCGELLMQAPITMDAARRFVPKNYTPLGDASGHAIVLVTLKACDDLRLDGTSIGSASTVDSGVFIVAPDDSAGFHYYQTWWLTNNSALVERLVPMGWNASLVNGTKLTEPRAAGAGGVARADVPWSAGAFALSANIMSGPATDPNHAVGWYDGSRGVVRVVKDLPSTALGAGPARFQGQGPMADLLGGTDVQGSAVWNVYDMTGKVEPAP